MPQLTLIVNWGDEYVPLSSQPVLVLGGRSTGMPDAGLSGKPVALSKVQ